MSKRRAMGPCRLRLSLQRPARVNRDIRSCWRARSRCHRCRSNGRSRRRRRSHARHGWYARDGNARHGHAGNGNARDGHGHARNGCRCWRPERNGGPWRHGPRHDVSNDAKSDGSTNAVKPRIHEQHDQLEPDAVADDPGEPSAKSHADQP